MHSTTSASALRCFGLLAVLVLALQAATAAAMAIDGASASNSIGGGSGAIATVAMCEPGVVEKMPAHIRKVCQALDSSTQLAASLYAYLHSQRSGNTKWWWCYATAVG